MKVWLFIGAVNGFLAVAAGAFGAHGLQGQISPENMAIFQTGAQYHLVHAVALVTTASAARQPGFCSRAASVSGWMFFIGMVLFSGSLYYLAITGSLALVLLTPLGGLSLLGGWAALAYGGWQAMRAPSSKG